MCTVELARRLDLGVDNLRLETLAAHWGVSQMQPHDALDDALVLAQILKPALVRARERKVWLPVRPVERRQLAQRAGHPRGAAPAEGDRVAAAVPVSQPGPLRRAADRWCRACGWRCRPR